MHEKIEFANRSACTECGCSIDPSEKCFDVMVVEQKWDDTIIIEPFRADGRIIPVPHAKGFVDSKRIPHYMRLCNSCYKKEGDTIANAFSVVRRNIRQHYLERFGRLSNAETIQSTRLSRAMDTLRFINIPFRNIRMAVRHSFKESRRVNH